MTHLHFFIYYFKSNQVWWYIPIILILEWQRQEDYMFEVTLELHNGILSQIPHLTHKPSKLFFRGFAGFQLSFVNEKPFPAQRDRIAL